MSCSALYYLIANCPAITSINMANCTEPANIDVLDVIPKGITRPLKYLNLKGSAVSDSLLRYAVSHVPDLKELYLESCISLTDYSIMKIANSCPKLSVLDISFCEKVTDVSLQIISIRASSMNGGNLEELSLSCCEQLTPLSIHQLVQKCTKLQLLQLDGCEKILGSFVHDYATFKNDVTCSFEVQDIKRLAQHTTKYTKKHPEQESTPPASPPKMLSKRASLRLARSASSRNDLEITDEQSEEFVEAFLQNQAEKILEKKSSRTNLKQKPQSLSTLGKKDVQKVRWSLSNMNLKSKLDVTAPPFVSTQITPIQEVEVAPSLKRQSKVNSMAPKKSPTSPINENVAGWGNNPKPWSNPAHQKNQASGWTAQNTKKFTSGFVDPWAPAETQTKPPAAPSAKERRLRKAQSQILAKKPKQRLSESSGWGKKEKGQFSFSKKDRGQPITKFMVETKSGGHQLLQIFEFDDPTQLSMEFCKHWDMMEYHPSIVKLITIRKNNALRNVK